MRAFLSLLLLLSIVSCRYNEPKAKYSIVEEDTIAIDQDLYDMESTSLEN